MKTSFGVFTLVVASVASFVFADKIVFVSGGELDCVVVKQSDTQTLVLLDESLLSIDKAIIKSIDVGKGSTPAYTEARIMPTSTELLKRAAVQPWATKLKQVPAFVIDRGVMRSIPYKSFRSGQYEINVYGDPSSPSGYEIGIYPALASDPESQKLCIAFVRHFLSEKNDIETLSKLKLEKDLVEHNGWTFEVTPPTAKDSFGGWWVSIYDKKKLDEARASITELKEVTQQVKIPEAKDGKDTSSSSTQKPITDEEPPSSHLSVAPKLKPSEKKAEPDSKTVDFNDLNIDTSYTRREFKESPKAPTSNTGLIWVNGYTKKNGTYVRGHYRRR